MLYFFTGWLPDNHMSQSITVIDILGTKDGNVLTRMKVWSIRTPPP